MQGLAEAGFELVSTGGSAKAMEAAGIPVKSVDQLTGFPEMLDGVPAWKPRALHAASHDLLCYRIESGTQKRRI
jgi:phosphoribosylaminoimidazolecarboxamide formyltransferase/IMP cyclohydrolase